MDSAAPHDQALQREPQGDAPPAGWAPAPALDAPIRLGLILNPAARSLRAGGQGALRALAEAAGEGAPVVETATRDEASLALRRLVLVERVNVLAVAGGDGTLHHTINALLALARERGAAGEPLATPRVLPLRGGTLNIIARGVSPTSDGPAASLGRLASSMRGAALSRVPTRRLPLLRVDGEGGGDARYGCIFGSEMVKNALELYDRFGGGYEGLSRFLFEAVRGYLFNTSLWKQEGWRLTPPPFGLHLHGPRQGLLPRSIEAEHAPPRPVPGYAAAVASTVDLTLGNGLVRTLRRAPHHDGFFARIITEARTGPLLKLIPALMREVKLDEVIDEPEARGIDLHGAFTLDGECYGQSSRAPEPPPPLRVRHADESLELIVA
jgi:hypothetical protein